MSDERQSDWVSQRAVAWVLDDAPCPAELLPVLVAIARRCDQDGKGSRQRTAVIAQKAGKSKKQAQRDIVKLREMKLLELGDPALVAHLPEHERPVVYDLPLHIKGPKPIKESRNPTGRKKGDTDTPSHGREGVPWKGGPPMEGESGDPMEGTPPPPLEGSQKKTVEEALEKPSLSARGDEPAPTDTSAPRRERDDQPPATKDQQIRAILARHNCTDLDATAVIDHWNQRPGGVKGIGWWKAVDRAGDTPGRIADVLEAAVDGGPTKPRRPPWCGRCHEQTRIRQDDDGARVYRCPDCHPSALQGAT